MIIGIEKSAVKGKQKTENKSTHFLRLLETGAKALALPSAASPRCLCGTARPGKKAFPVHGSGKVRCHFQEQRGVFHI